MPENSLLPSLRAAQFTPASLYRYQHVLYPIINAAIPDLRLYGHSTQSLDAQGRSGAVLDFIPAQPISDLPLYGYNNTRSLDA
jgi:hypothetical protein